MKEYLRCHIPTPPEILNNPKDLHLRLIYCDQLEENDGYIPCPSCTVLPEGVSWSFSMDAEGRRTYHPCDDCDGERRVPNYFKARADFIRHQINFTIGHLPSGVSAKLTHSAGILTPIERGFTLANCPGGALLGNIIYHNGIYRNGFLFNVGMPVNTFLGMENCHCGRKLDKMVLTEATHHCDRCRDGRLIMTGLAKPLFENHPIEEVEFTDLEPFEDSFQNQPRFAWFKDRNYLWAGRSDPESKNENAVPNSLWSLLEGYIIYHASLKPSQIKWYKTILEAKAALSRAAVQYGRTLAGLPSLS